MNSLKVLDFKIDHNLDLLQKYVFELSELKIETFIFETFHFKIRSNSLEKSLELCSINNEEFNFDYIYIICSQITKLKIMHSNSEKISKLLCSYSFPNLLELEIEFCEIARIEKKLFVELPMLKKLMIHFNLTLQTIDEDAFSDLKQLVHLDLSYNRIESLEKMTFFELVNLNYLDLSVNRLRNIDENAFWRLKKLKTLNLNHNDGLPHFLHGDLLRYIRGEYVFDNFYYIILFQFFLLHLVDLILIIYQDPNDYQVSNVDSLLRITNYFLCLLFFIKSQIRNM